MRGPNGGVLLKVALLGSEDDRYYLSPVGVITVIYCCERHIRGMAGSPGYASALQWFKSREPKISQEDFDSITDNDVVVNIAALKKSGFWF